MLCIISIIELRLVDFAVAAIVVPVGVLAIGCNVTILSTVMACPVRSVPTSSMLIGTVEIATIAVLVLVLVLALALVGVRTMMVVDVVVTTVLAVMTITIVAVL